VVFLVRRVGEGHFEGAVAGGAAAVLGRARPGAVHAARVVPPGYSVWSCSTVMRCSQESPKSYMYAKWALLPLDNGRGRLSTVTRSGSVATARKLWPDVEILCASEPLELDDYVKSIGDEKLVPDMLVGDLQRVIEYPKLGFAIEQEAPEDVRAAYESLIHDGFTSRLIAS